MAFLKLFVITLIIVCCNSFPNLHTEFSELEEDSGNFANGLDPQEGSQEIEENVSQIDPRMELQRHPAEGLGPYSCSSDQQCANSGTCVATHIGENICNCTRHHLGPFCDYSASFVDHALRVHPMFKVSFSECMAKAGRAAGVNVPKILSQCGGGQNLCWLREGGLKGLKCFYWCVSNGMQSSMTEAEPKDDSRLQLYAEVFQKLSNERHLTKEKSHPKRPKGVPIYSMEISLYDTSQPSYPYPQHNHFNIKPSVTFWPPSIRPYPSPPHHQPFGPYYPNSGPNNTPFEFPRSHENPVPHPRNMDTHEENSIDNFWNELMQNPDPYGWEEPPLNEMNERTREPTPIPTPATPSTNFLNEALHDVMQNLYNMEVVENNGENDDDYDIPREHYDDFFSQLGRSNMRDA